MPETITTFKEVAKKPGSNDNGAYVLTTFTDVEGKKFKTFNDDLAAKGESLMNQAISVGFELKSRTWDGRTLVDNMISSLGAPGETTVASNGGSQPRTASPNPPIANRIFAMKVTVELLGTAPEMFGKEDSTPGIVDLMKVADMIYDWADRSQEKASEPDPEPEPEPVTN